jgi:PTH1 family peptidyl-tRNA hydrolase
MGRKMLIVGLGNPGREYEKTRHNAGFIAMDFFANKKAIGYVEKFGGLFNKIRVGDNEVFLLKPLTYMNNSGQSVIQVVNFYKINPADVVVMHDDMDIPVGDVRYKTKGSAGGHNGIKSIIQHLGTQEFKRVKIGVSKPVEMTVVDYVLGKFSKEDRKLIDNVIETNVYRFLDLYTQNSEKDAFDKVISKLANDIK